MFVGPKDIDLLRHVNPKLEGAVDFGWFAIIARPIFLILHWLHDNYVPNYGWCIILLTLAINMLLLPLKLSGMKGMKKMSALQPEIQKINEKYEGLAITDPKKAQQNEEIMALYKKHGVNPLGAGCMPLVLQIPFFFAFYKVLSVAIDLRGADWLWIRDLSHFDPLYLLPSGDGHHAVRPAEDDAEHNCRSRAAKDDDVHAADVRVPVFQSICGPCTILVNQ